jgi:hypothetical protein
MNFKTIIGKALAFGVLFSTLPALASTDIGVKYYGKGLCNHPDFYCTKVERGGRWTSVFPDPHQRDIVQRVNRTYNWLPRGKVLAIPKNIDEVTIFDVSPFPLKEDTEGEKQIIVDQEKLAWGAYDENGALVNWGPISSGKDYCPDIAKGCRTKTGVFRFFGKQGTGCRSRTFGNARMPYCMFFFKGFALHGSDDIPGKRASHGCVRMFTHDAKWLNHNFVEVSHDRNDYKGTKVIVRELNVRSRYERR